VSKPASDRREPSLDVQGPAAPPRRNGELLFAAPWESRVFGIAVALHRQGAFEWNEFRDCLIAEIARWEQRGHERVEGEWSYYARWQTALETLLARKGLCAAAELDAREHALAARPAGHDHLRV
jgi:nitrile hydratase accessory protein